MEMGTERRDILLEVKNLSVDYYATNGIVHAVNDVSFTLRRGQILGIAGESGSGKSTLAYAIARLHRPPAVITGGEVIYYPPQKGSTKEAAVQHVSLKNNGREPEGTSFDILQLSPAQLRAFRWNELSIVFQSAMNALNPVLDIGTQIMDALQTHRPEMGPDARKRRAIDLLNLVGIAADRLNSYPHELSGGMRQRAVIAIALSLNPELIILDEPTTALDVVVQREILELISSLCKELGTSLIFITHDLSLLLELADTIAVMYAGKIVETGNSSELYHQSRHPYSYGLLNSFPTLHGPRRKMIGIPGTPPDLRNLPIGCSFSPRCPLAFEVCHMREPDLTSVTREQAGQLVSCHLYNPLLNVGEPPSKARFAARYGALVEGNRAR